MSERVELDPDRLRTAARKTAHVRDRIDGVMSTLRGSLAGRGAPWGGDTIGTQFFNGPNGGDGYEASVTNLNLSTSNIATTFGNFSNNQYTTAGYLENQDEHNADGFN
ncbi:WXG100 family type VII secretion target [Nocardia takedensis]|uniref:WXG100 family type VII secretion target n=1 Tax=Nocardia takedensis TaxID=259390 RepID=UPI00030512DF|nr:hypothetical protein [Nocardia takedensis]